MPRYIAIRTDKEQRSFILSEIEQGRLRQGWGYDPTQDLRLIRTKVRSDKPLQVKRFVGVHDDTHAIRQITLAKEHHKIDAGIIVTTAIETSDEFDAALAQAESDLGIDIRVIARDEWIELVMKHIGTARKMPHAALLELLRTSAQTTDLRESTSVTNLVYADLRRLLERGNQFLEFGVWHQNRGNGEHVIRVDLPDAINAAVLSAIESRLRRMIPDASLRRNGMSITVIVRGLTT
jgi:hypothetical protein